MRVSSPGDLGPWRWNQSIEHARQHQTQLPASPTQAKKQSQPKLPQLAFERQFSFKLREKKPKPNETVKPSPFELPFASRILRNKQLLSLRKQRTLSYEPPMISFYNKNHPKLKQRRKMYESVKVEGEGSQGEDGEGDGDERRQKELRIVNKIDLMDGYLRSSAGYSALRYKRSPEKQPILSKKRSLTELLKFLNSNPKDQTTINKSSQQKQFLRYTEMEDNLLQFYSKKEEPQAEKIARHYKT